MAEVFKIFHQQLFLKQKACCAHVVLFKKSSRRISRLLSAHNRKGENTATKIQQPIITRVSILLFVHLWFQFPVLVQGHPPFRVLNDFKWFIRFKPPTFATLIPNPCPCPNSKLTHLPQFQMIQNGSNQQLLHLWSQIPVLVQAHPPFRVFSHVADHFCFDHVSAALTNDRLFSMSKLSTMQKQTYWIKSESSRSL